MNSNFFILNRNENHKKCNRIENLLHILKLVKKQRLAIFLHGCYFCLVLMPKLKTTFKFLYFKMVFNCGITSMIVVMTLTLSLLRSLADNKRDSPRSPRALRPGDGVVATCASRKCGRRRRARAYSCARRASIESVEGGTAP